ncbi:disulfide isomerase [Fistulina hepatica ATCC 64428]|nr:disulfide isomerase [Fistulina hepatica ATCC 64428]
MRLSSLSALASLAAVALAADVSDVISLTASTFEPIVNPESLMLVEFFAPWCGHCKNLAPHYEEAATALREHNIKLAKVDCVDQADLCSAQDVGGYPTLKVFRNGASTEYNGPRKADGIISYMKKQALPAVSDVNPANHEQFKKEDNIVVIAYAKSQAEDPIPAFRAFAEEHRDDYLFGLVTDEDLTALDGVVPPMIVVYRSFDEPRVEYPYPIKSVTGEDLESWLNDLSIPVIDEVNGENYAAYASSSKPLAYLFLDPTDEKKQEYIDAIRPVALTFKPFMNFVWIDAVRFGDHGKALNLHEVKWPAFVIQNIEKQLKYPFPQSKEVTPEAVSQWAQDYLDDKLVPELKSSSIPESQDEPVFVLVGKQFEEIVFDDSKDVFVEFYASWCGHCKRLKPTWDELGKTFAPFKNTLTIAKMEAQENDLPPSVPFRVSGFPTLKFKPAGTRDFIDYDGDRSLESLVEFVNQHSVNSLVAPPAEPALSEEKQAPVGAGPANETVEIHDEL